MFFTSCLPDMMGFLVILMIRAVVFVIQLADVILAKTLPQATLESLKKIFKDEKKASESIASPEVNSQPSAPSEAVDTSVKEEGACDKKIPSLLSPSADAFLPTGSLSQDTVVKSSVDEKSSSLSASAFPFVPGTSIVKNAAAKASDEEDTSLTHSLPSSPSHSSGGKGTFLSPSYPASSKSSASSNYSHSPALELNSAIVSCDAKESSVSQISVWASSVQHEAENSASEKKGLYDSIFTPAKRTPVKISNAAGTLISFSSTLTISSAQHEAKSIELEPVFASTQCNSVKISKDTLVPSASITSTLTAQHNAEKPRSEPEGIWDSIYAPSQRDSVKTSKDSVVRSASTTSPSTPQHKAENLRSGKNDLWGSIFAPAKRSCVKISFDTKDTPVKSASVISSITPQHRATVTSCEKKVVPSFISGVAKASTTQQKIETVPENKGIFASIHAPLAQRKSVATCERIEASSSARSVFTPVAKHRAANIPSSKQSAFVSMALLSNSPPEEVSTISYTTSQDNLPQKGVLGKMSPANIDDTASFMAAVRALRQNQTSSTPTPTLATATAAAAEEASNQQDDTWKSLKGSAGTSANASVNGADAIDANSVSATKEAGSIAESPKHVPNISEDALSFATEAGALMGPSEQEEDRENLAIFETWGTPAARGKPAARVRTIIIKGLPSTWATPAKVLSLVHGGLVENVSVSTSGTAHVRFCDADACQAFYDKYPNGIDLDKSRKATVFVEMGKDVNVVSSQLSFHLSVGATRVVRAVGVDLDVTMTQMIRLATSQNRKIEKIVDSYVPGEARSASFRFCSIEEAVRFRAALVRDADWEHCNVQYANDPCDVATGMHVD